MFFCIILSFIFGESSKRICLVRRERYSTGGVWVHPEQVLQFGFDNIEGIVWSTLSINMYDSTSVKSTNSEIGSSVLSVLEGSLEQCLHHLSEPHGVKIVHVAFTANTLVLDMLERHQ